jgi:hypothetical protein
MYLYSFDVCVSIFLQIFLHPLFLFVSYILICFLVFVICDLCFLGLRVFWFVFPCICVLSIFGLSSDFGVLCFGLYQTALEVSCAYQVLLKSNVKRVH